MLERIADPQPVLPFSRIFILARFYVRDPGEGGRLPAWERRKVVAQEDMLDGGTGRNLERTFELTSFPMWATRRYTSHPHGNSLIARFTHTQWPRLYSLDA